MVKLYTQSQNCVKIFMAKGKKKPKAYEMKQHNNRGKQVDLSVVTTNIIFANAIFPQQLIAQDSHHSP